MNVSTQAPTYPCTNCTRVKAPQNCENKNCTVWQKWFLSQWELLRRGAGCLSPCGSCHCQKTKNTKGGLPS